MFLDCSLHSNGMKCGYQTAERGPYLKLIYFNMWHTILREPIPIYLFNFNVFRLNPAVGQTMISVKLSSM
jgi:hypothetical protein